MTYIDLDVVQLIAAKPDPTTLPPLEQSHSHRLGGHDTRWRQQTCAVLMFSLHSK